MASLAKPSQKGRGKKKGDKKPAKIVPDPDAAYRQQLDETLYIPKVVRKKVLDTYGKAADSAIMANTVAASSSQLDAHRERPISFIKVPRIFWSLGLCLTDDQIDQIKAMIAQNSQHVSQENSAANLMQQVQRPGSFADREKLRTLLVELLHTHVLTYDPQVLTCPHPRFPDRVSSVVYSSTEGDIRSCFDKIWEVTGKQMVMGADGRNIRCVAVEQLEELLVRAQTEEVATKALTERELQDFYFLVKDVNDDVVREDAFLNCFIHAQ
ncbi:conserved hypothetical protein [Leishmania major strain Friedlin]|uniref:Uncharacterized protein n=1 Tax=Leishmania major TaxID=5664 RepID=Q4QHF6_LEIMA|nr:conserved hypothetical protein [Leishmania major strain Friedlin]CAG9570040.1 hypothetical_protein_-_conserved [Leishmania major strain Friedlin]CAJ02675.1 conserved hypothetical protein [Leishmania major strain Friedlin]|eukprot:XP_001681392.1 conserved hypothetical protein [Leishmania major strain Friedlin]